MRLAEETLQERKGRKGKEGMEGRGAEKREGGRGGEGPRRGEDLTLRCFSQCIFFSQSVQALSSSWLCQGYPFTN